MVKGYQSDAWNHTSELLAMMAKTGLDGEWAPSDFHPDHIAERAKTKQRNFDAKFFAIRLCGQKAVDAFNAADKVVR